MRSYEPPFHWIQFGEGRARFAGAVRGVDERGHETVAVQIGESEYFGEIARSFCSNGNDYNIEVVSFGFGDAAFAGEPMTPGICLVLDVQQAADIAAILTALIAEGARMAKRPHVLKEYPDAHFMGEVFFRDGWLLAAQETGA